MMFADDLLMLARADIPSIELMFKSFSKFSHASGLAANLDKSEVFFGGIPEYEKAKMQGILGMARGSIPFKYLGAPVSSKKLSIAECRPLVDRVVARIKSWSNKKLSYAGRVQMIKSVLFGIQTYWAQIFILPKKIIKEIESKFRCYLWTGSCEKSKKCPVAWDQVCLPKVSGGWNILSLVEWNTAAICRVLWDLAHKADSLWVRWVHMYYFKRGWWHKEITTKCSWNLKRIMKCRALVDSVGGWEQLIHHGKFKISKMYAQLRPQREKVPWRNLICNNAATPKSTFILWMALQNRLATADRLSSWHISCNPTCGLCNNAPETLAHLFFECNYSSEIWKHLQDSLGMDIGFQFAGITQRLQKHSSSNTPKKQLLCMFFTETVYAIWIERNNLIFNRSCKPPNVVIRNIIYNVACKCSDKSRALLVK